MAGGFLRLPFHTYSPLSDLNPCLATPACPTNTGNRCPFLSHWLAGERRAPPLSACGHDGGGGGGLRKRFHSPSLRPPSPVPASPRTDEKSRGAPSWEANPGAFSPSGLLSGLAKTHELANGRSALKAGLCPPWRAPQSGLALPCLCLGVCTRRLFTRRPPQWGHPWKRLAQAQWEPSWMTLEAVPLGWASEAEARWPGRSGMPSRIGMEGAGSRASSSSGVLFKDWEALPSSFFKL